MSDYTKVYDGAALDTAEAAISGADFDTEFAAIEVSDNSKVDKASIQTITGAKTFNGVLDGTGLLNAIFPVGAIYQSSVNVSPAVALGGVWTSLRGMVLMAEDGTTGYIAGDTGGSKDQGIPSHTHGFSGTTTSDGSHTHTAQKVINTQSSGTLGGGGSAKDSAIVTDPDGVHTHGFSGTTVAAGESPTDLNMPPYKAVYMWERTA